MSLYNELFEGKFTKTNRHLHLNLLQRFYYNFSPSTYTERAIFKKIAKVVSGEDIGKLKILDLGCGGGHEKLNYYGAVYGVDVSAASVENAKKIYHAACALDITTGLSFGQDEFDLIFCSEVLGHIAAKDKNSFLVEAKRVLKPGGYIVISTETDGDNWFTRLLKKQNLYDSCWIEQWGHIGLMAPDETIRLIRKYFRVIEVAKTSTWLLSIDNYMAVERHWPFLRIFNNNVLRRLCNLLLYLPYRISLVASSLNSSNDIVLLGRNDP